MTGSECSSLSWAQEPRHTGGTDCKKRRSPKVARASSSGRSPAQSMKVTASRSTTISVGASRCCSRRQRRSRAVARSSSPATDRTTGVSAGRLLELVGHVQPSERIVHAASPDNRRGRRPGIRSPRCSSRRRTRRSRTRLVWTTSLGPAARTCTRALVPALPGACRAPHQVFDQTRPSCAACRRTASLSGASTKGTWWSHVPDTFSTRPSPGSSRTSRM